MDNRTLTDGSPVPEDNSHTTLKASGQQQGYVVLSAEERAKGFVRPVRDAYKHVGIPGPEYPLRDLTAAEAQRYGDTYDKYENYPKGKGSALGRFWSQADLAAVDAGCQTVTTMSRGIAETYAREPGFYGGTFCTYCGKHMPVGRRGEFVWLDDGTRVGT